MGCNITIDCETIDPQNDKWGGHQENMFLNIYLTHFYERREVIFFRGKSVCQGLSRFFQHFQDFF